jgi:tetratricopeptide (TPR) repeat protein
MGQTGEILRHSRQAVELDPFNPLVYGLYAGVLNYARRYAEAEAAARTTLDLQPDSPIGRSQLSLALEAQGKYDEPLRMLRKSYADDADLTAALERGYAEAGYPGSQRSLADLLAVRYKRSGGIRAQNIGEKYYVAGDYERAVEWFEKAFENHEGNLPYITRPYFYDTLRSDPRYLDLLRRMGVPAER